MEVRTPEAGPGYDHVSAKSQALDAEKAVTIYVEDVALSQDVQVGDFEDVEDVALMNHRCSALPEEVLVQVAEHLYTPKSILDESSTPSTYRDLLAFCRTNKQLGRAGQEILFRHCDLTLRPYRQPYLLLRTLLEMPALVPKVTSITLYSDSPRRSHTHIDASSLRLVEAQEIYKYLSAYNQGLDIPVDACATWLSDLSRLPNLATDSVVTSLSLLLSATTNLRHLTIRNVRHYHELFDKLKILVTQSPPLALQSLHSLTIQRDQRVTADGIHFLAHEPWLLHLPKLRNLDMVLEKTSSHFEGATIGPADPSALLASSHLTHFTITGWSPPHFVKTVLSYFNALTSFTYTIRMRYDGREQPMDGPQEVWDSLLPARHTLQHLHITYLDETAIWPLNMHLFPALRSIELRGAFYMDRQMRCENSGPVARSNVAVSLKEDWLPLNVEVIVLVSEEGAWDPLFEDLQLFADKGPARRGLKTVVMGREMDGAVGGDGVHVWVWDVKSGRVVLKGPGEWP
jgi:hypothetical protein